jgi:hypothetical protein
MKTNRAILTLALLLAGSSQSIAAAVNDGNGKEWRQLTETEGLTWNQAASICPRDGVTPCHGVVANHDLTDWVWATEPQVLEFFSLYEPAMQTQTSVSGFPYFFTASSFLGVMQPTFSFAITYSTGAWTGGWTCTTDDAGFPFGGGVQTATTPVSVSGGFGVATATNADESSDRGVFLWRPTGAGSGAPVANDDSGSVLSPDGGRAVANVLANDWMDGEPATVVNVVLTAESSSNLGVSLDVGDGSVQVAAGTPAGTYTLLYRICAPADPSRCDGAAVRVTVPPYVVHAVNDQGSVSPSTGGTAIANVLANDLVGSMTATPATVAMTALSSSSAAVTLDTGDGSVDVVRGAAIGTQTLLYKICELANPTNCDTATATVSIQPYVIDAVADSARASSKTGGVAIASVLSNDRLGGAAATTTTVKLAQVTAPPKGVTFSLSNGSVTVAPKTTSGTFSFVYQICERADLTNCDQATVTLDLSGRSN